MPATSGWTSRSSASRPSRRRTNEATLSSPRSVRDGIHRSSPILSLPSGLKIGEATTGQIFAGAISMKPSGTGTEPPFPQHQGLAVPRIGGDQAAFEPESAAQIDGPRLVCDKRIRSAFDETIGNRIGMDHAPEPRASLEEGDAEGQRGAVRNFDQAVCRRQTANSAPDDRDTRHAT